MGLIARMVDADNGQGYEYACSNGCERRSAGCAWAKGDKPGRLCPALHGRGVMLRAAAATVMLDGPAASQRALGIVLREAASLVFCHYEALRDADKAEKTKKRGQ